MPQKLQKESQNVKKYQIFSAVLLIAVLILLSYILTPNSFYTSVASAAIPQLSTSGFTKANVSADIVDKNTASITLSADCYNLVGNVEPSQALSIQNALNNQYDARPNAHDLVKDVFTALKINVLMVKVTEMRGGIYFAKIVIRQGNTILNYDVRPSDGVAIALRMNAPVYVNQTLLTSQGSKVC